jgi:hypothetical protein
MRLAFAPRSCTRKAGLGALRSTDPRDHVRIRFNPFSAPSDHRPCARLKRARDCAAKPMDVYRGAATGRA